MVPVPYIVRRIWAVFLILQSQIICIRGDCGPPPVIEHTQPVEVTSGVPGDTVDYLCDRSTGYYEIPNKSRTITCQVDNMWSTVTEFCARACGVPERLRFAVPRDSDLEKDIFLPGTTVTFNCRPGYKRVPRSNNVITCLDNYTWSTPSEFCELRSCGHPQDTENGDFDVTNSFFFGSRVTYKCNDGYRLTSRRNYRDCQADGTWSNAVPECEVVVCPAPYSPAGGTYNPFKDEYTYQEAVTFTCNRGLHITGESTASCIGNGTWSSSSPTCKEVNCADPGQVQNGRRTSGFVGPYTLNSAVSYSCEGNFVLNGSSTISCTVNNRWEPEIPKCLTVCDTPPNPSYAVLEERFTNINYFDKTTVLYTCKAGYTRDPNKVNEITCLGRSWSELAKFCSPISCGDPGDVPNAHRSVSEFTFGSIITYTCQNGYTMTAIKSINYKECLADGTWSGSEIICSAACQIPRVDNARISDMKNVYVQDDVVMFECNKDFVLNGSKEITCNSRGQWEPSPPKCNATCRIPEIAKSQLSDLKRVLLQDDVLLIKCEQGYDLSGSSTIKCSSQGQWEPSLPECKESRKGLSTGAIAGISIGCLLAATAVGLLYWWFSKTKTGKPKSDTPDVQYTACNDA